jgi:hypothetical protein
MFKFKTKKLNKLRKKQFRKLFNSRIVIDNLSLLVNKNNGNVLVSKDY